MTIRRALAWLGFACAATIALGLSASVVRVFFDREPETLYAGGEVE